jgi:SulP family sulfate permease
VPGLAAGAVCAAVLLAGSALLAFVPNPVLGGLLMYLGLDFLYQWVIRGWSRLSRAEYAAMVLIMVVIGAVDFLVGIGVGLLTMILIFVLSYSRTDPVRITLSGADVASNVPRCAHHRQALRELGQHVYVVRLQGFLFFGTANAVLEQIRARVNDRTQPPVRHIIVDLCQVTGLDSSAIMSFLKGRQLAEGQGISLSLADLSDRVRRQFEAAGFLQGENAPLVFADLDRALEWCEDRLLASEHLAQAPMPATLRAQLEDGGFPQQSTDCLMRFLERLPLEAGEYLVRQGDESYDLYFVEKGEVSIHLELEGNRRARLRTIGPGSVVGELGFWVGSKRTASVIADSPTVAYRLTQAALAEMRTTEPELVTAFQDFMVRLLAERLVATTHTLETVLW